MLLFNELDFDSPIKIYNKYANYPKVNNFKKNFFLLKKQTFTLVQLLVQKLNFSSPLENEMKEFLLCLNGNKKPLTSSKISIDIMKTLEKLK